MVRQFVQRNDLQPADVIIAKKKGWYVWDHYIVYIGMERGRMLFIGNDMTGGVRIMDEEEVSKLIDSFVPTKIRKFQGDFWDQQQALARANAELGKRYNLISFNCEHLANYIQYGVRESKQSENWLLVSAALLLLVSVVGSKN